MCGIVGYIGDKKVTPILIDGLLKLEYRGYDSAGIAVIENNNLVVMKDQGRVSNLQNIDGINNLSGTVGIAHTRWATHGKPSRENAHPHMDNSNSFAVVHNGIIENFKQLRDFLLNNGYVFYSQTDSEVVPNLIHYYFQNTSKNSESDFLEAVQLACNDLQGSYALEIVCNLFPNTIIATRRNSPLILGKGINENYIGSDVPAILSFTNNFYFLENNEIAVLSKNNIRFFDSSLNQLHKDVRNISCDASSITKNGYEDFMLKEIFEQPKAIKETVDSILTSNGHCNFSSLNFSKSYLNTINKIYIVACGTAMHAGLTGKNIIENLCKIPVTVDIASEFRYQNPLIDIHTLCIFISQSGETADTIAALKLAKSQGSKTITITNVYESSITRESDYSIYTKCGPEIAVASTKAYTSQVVILGLLSIYFAEILEKCDKSIITSLKNSIMELPDKINLILHNCDDVQKFANEFYKATDIFFLGRGTDYNVSLEGSLKLKEISYIHSEAYAAGELKHGPIALIENGTPIIATITDSKLSEKTISNIEEVISRGAKTLIITNQTLPTDNFDYIFKIPDINKFLSPILSIIPMQLFSYYISKKKGLDVDKPRNLAKSVTVE